MLRGLVLFITALVLTGCGAIRAQQAAKVQAQQQADIANCKQQFPLAPKANHVALTRCMKAVADQYSPDDPYRDLVSLYLAKRMAIAVQQDAGKISEEDGEVKIAQAYNEAVREQQQRMYAQGAIAAQQTAANAAALSAFGNSMQQAGAALQAASPPPPTICRSIPSAGGIQTICQ